MHQTLGTVQMVDRVADLLGMQKAKRHSHVAALLHNLAPTRTALEIMVDF
jgi:hypothetical protein